MRLVHVVRSGAFAGVERYLTYVAPELAARGHEVVVVGGEPQRMAEALGPSEVEVVAATSFADVVRSLWGMRRPDLVHAHMTAAEAAAAVAHLRHRGPIVATMHFAQPRGGGGAKAVAYRPLGRLITTQVAISQFVADSIGSPSVVVANGVPDVPPPGVARRPVVLTGQRLETEKDTATALRAWRTSGLGDRGWELHLAGSGAERGALEQLAVRLGITPSVRFLGHVEDVRDRMASASVFLATAPREPFGLSVVEAMAASTPLVAASGGAHVEVLAGTDDRQLFAPGDVDACAAALVAWCDDPRGRDAAGRENRDRYEEAYTVERHVDGLEGVYREVLGR